MLLESKILEASSNQCPELFWQANLSQVRARCRVRTCDFLRVKQASAIFKTNEPF
jgi:hypothetical protein